MISSLHLVLADPVTVGLGIAGLVSTVAPAAIALANRPKSPQVPLVPPPPSPAQQPQGTQTTNTPAGTPSFLAAAAAPTQQNTASKTLLGQ